MVLRSFLVVLIGLCQIASGFRILESGASVPNYSYPKPYEAQFVGIYGDPTNLQREKINEGSFESPDQELLYEGVSPRQACPNMVGPFSDGNYYCTAREFGYCDRRSGTCFCNVGYRGIDCTDCSDTHYKIGSVCFPRKLCPLDCSGAGTCDYNTGMCECLPHRQGISCEILLCSRFSPLCTSCDTKGCLNCASGYYLNGKSDVCGSCYDFDPRCAGCTLDLGCTTCADSLLTSVHRSGYRTSDPLLPIEENTRELSITLPFGTKSPESFADAENYEVVANATHPLKDTAKACSQGPVDDIWHCQAASISHEVCGHFGVFTFKYPNYEIAENANSIRMVVMRSGGGYGDVQITYSIKHFTTNDSDLVATAPYTTTQRLNFDAGVIERSFLITIADDNLVEENEVFQVVLETPEGGGAVGAQFRANVTIIDDDAPLLNPKLSKCLQNTTQVSPAVPFDVYVQAVNGDGIPLNMGGEQFYSIIGNNPDEYENIDNPYNSTATLRQPMNVTDLGNGVYKFTSVKGIARTGVFDLHIYHAFPMAIRGDYFFNGFLTNLAVSRLDQKIDFKWGTGRLIPSGTDFISVRWTGGLKPDVGGLYQFSLKANDYARLYINNVLLINNWYGQGTTQFTNISESIFLVGHVLHEVVVEYLEMEGDAYCTLLWKTLTTPLTVVPQRNLFALYEIDRSPVKVTVVGGASTAATTGASGSGLGEATASITSNFSVCPRDSFGNLINDGDYYLASSQLFSARMTLLNPSYYDGVGPEVINPTFTFNNETFCFDCSYNAKVAGNYSLEVFYQNVTGGVEQPIQGSPFYVWVYPDKTNGPMTRVTGIPAPLYMTAGDCFNFTITTRDANQNLRKTGGDDISVYMFRVDYYANTPGDPQVLPHTTMPTSQPTGSPTSMPSNVKTADRVWRTSPPSDAPNGVDVVRYGRVTDKGDGTYIGEVCPVIQGVYEIHVMLDGQGVSNQPFQIIDKWHSMQLNDMGLGTGFGQYIDDSPYSLVVKHADASQVTSTAVGEGLEAAIVGVPVNFMLTVRDPYDNVLRSYDTPTVVDAYLDRSPNANISIWNYHNGSYNIQYIAKLPGDNLISVKVNGFHIRASPFTVSIVDGATSPRYSFATGSGLYVGVTGETSYFQVYAYDLDNNRKTTADNLYTFIVSGANNLGPIEMEPCPSPPVTNHPICDPYDTQLGHYWGNFTPTITGTNYINVYLEDTSSSSGRRLTTAQVLHVSNFESLVTPSAPKAESTDITGALYDNIAGVTAYVGLHLRDYFGNLLISGGRSIEIVLLAVGIKWGTDEPFTPLEGRANEFYYEGFYNQYSNVYGNMTDNLDGTYTLAYNAPKAGDYVMRLALAEDGLNATYFNTTNFGLLYDNNHNEDTYAATKLGVPVNLGSTISWTGDIGGVPGVRGDMGSGSYFNKFLSRKEKLIDFDLTNTTIESYMGNSDGSRYKFRNHFWSVRWTGLIVPKVAETYKFSAVVDSESTLRVFVGGVGNEFNGSHKGDLVLNTKQGETIPGFYQFTDTRYREIVVEYAHFTGDPFLSLFWESVSTPKEVIPSSAFFHWRNISHFNTTIHPAPLCSSCSTAYGAALTSAQVAVKKSFVVYGRDRFSNLMEVGGDVPTMVAIGRDGVAFRGEVTDYGNSTYLIEYYPTQSGTFRMFVTIGCCVVSSDYGYPLQLELSEHLNIKGSPFILTVTPAPVDQSRSVLNGKGLLGGTADEVLTFTTSYRDIHNNPTSLDNALDAKLYVTFMDAVTLDIVEPRLLNFTYSATDIVTMYHLTRAGKFIVNATLSIDGGNTSSPIIGSPFTIFISPVKPVPEFTVCRGLGLKQATQNRSASFEVQLYDRYHNNLIVGGDKLYVRLLGDARFEAASLPVVPLCSDTQNGRYICKYNPVEQGTHELVVRLLNNSVLHPGGMGLTGYYYNSVDDATAMSPATIMKIDSTVSFNFESGLVVPTYDGLSASLAGPAIPLSSTAGQSIRWTGYLIAPKSDLFSIVVNAVGCNVSVYLDSILIFDNVADIKLSVPLVADASYAIRVIASIQPTVKRQPVSIDLRWSTPTVHEYTIPSFFLYDSAVDVALSPFPVVVGGN